MEGQNPMIFAHTWRQIIGLEQPPKTQTRRIVKPNDTAMGRHLQHIEVDGVQILQIVPSPTDFISVKRGGRLLWQVGNSCAVQQGRGKPAIARIQILESRREPLCNITHDDALAEGFGGVAEFLNVWQAMYAGTEYAATHNPHVWVLGFELVGGAP
jgi:hypothetical protein